MGNGIKPQLRFPTFTEEWAIKRFSDLYSFKITNSLSRENLSYESGSIKNIHYGDIHTKFNTHFNILSELVPYINPEFDLSRIAEENYLKEGDLVIADASEDYNDIGKSIEIMNLNNEKVLAGLHTFLARKESDEIQNGFMSFLLKTRRVRLDVMKIAQGTKVLSLSSKRLGEISLNIPKIEEQQKITSFLSALESHLQLLDKKKKALERYKKGVMKKIFDLEIRFKDKNGNEFPKWEEKTLGEISENPKYGLNSSAIKYDGENGYLRITDIDDKSNRFNNLKITSPDSFNDDFLLSENDLLFARTGASTGKSYLYKKRDGKLYFGGFLIKFKIKGANSKFIFYQTLLPTYQKWVKVMSMRSGQPGINAEEYTTLPILLPCIEEQSEIANFISAIDETIELVNEQMGRVKEYIKGLLQQMFV